MSASKSTSLNNRLASASDSNSTPSTGPEKNLTGLGRWLSIDLHCSAIQSGILIGMRPSEFSSSEASELSSEISSPSAATATGNSIDRAILFPLCGPLLFIRFSCSGR